MSAVDTRFAEAERSELLQEVRSQLPAFLSAAASEQTDPLGDVSELLNLTKRDLDRVTAVHVALDASVRQFVTGLAAGMRSPVSSTERPRVATQSVRGPIDWGATIRHQTQTGTVAGIYIVRPARRVFDTPENRALAWALDALDRFLRLARPATTDGAVADADRGWAQELGAAGVRVRESRRLYWLRSVQPERPDAIAMRRLTGARSALYKVHLPALITTLHRYTQDPSADDVTELLSQRYFRPDRDWQLFEVVVALRVARAFAERSIGRRRARLLVGGGRAPFARYLISPSHEVRLWYQAWPTTAGASLHRDVVQRYSIQAGPTRPDLVVELLHHGVTVDAVLLELKATRSASYLGAGVLQLLGYLKDRPGLFLQRPAGWLVAPRSSAFESVDPAGLEVWAVNADDVASALVDRVFSRL